MVPSTCVEFKHFETDAGAEGCLKDDFMSVLFDVGHTKTFLGYVKGAE